MGYAVSIRAECIKEPPQPRRQARRLRRQVAIPAGSVYRNTPTRTALSSSGVSSSLPSVAARAQHPEIGRLESEEGGVFYGADMPGL